MQTDLHSTIKNTPLGIEANDILRSCVHCGFCSATCPTYQHFGDELDSPRGRIYLIKQMLEGNEVSAKTQTHLDRCLTCRACETTCPSGVKYGRLVTLGREYLDEKVPRSLLVHGIRKALCAVLPYPNRLAFLIKTGQLLKPILPARLKHKLPQTQPKSKALEAVQARKMIVLSGCAQSVVKAGTNDAASKVFSKLGISLIVPPAAGCCGAVSYHLDQHQAGLDFMRRNIDVWWPLIEAGCEAILINASGCGLMVKEYAEALKGDINYAEKAARISALAKDPCEILAGENLKLLQVKVASKKVAFQSPCSLQHGQQLAGRVESILSKLGFELCQVPDNHLCCGSAGTYSILQPKLSAVFLTNKLTALMSEQPDIIATANIGCHMHLETKSSVPVKHWVELIADNMH